MEMEVGLILKKITLQTVSGLALRKFCLRQNALERNIFVNSIFQNFVVPNREIATEKS
jgi:hypothetical protein